jgi:hypothetical protein
VFLEKSAPLYGGLARGPMIVNQRQQVREFCLSDGATTVELLEPLAEGSPVQGFLRRIPSGRLVHLALDVVDLDASMAGVMAAGGRLLVGPVPDIAFAERRIAFVFLAGQVTGVGRVSRLGAARGSAPTHAERDSGRLREIRRRPLTRSRRGYASE